MTHAPSGESIELPQDVAGSSGHIEEKQPWGHPSELFAAGICFSLSFATYLYTLSPTVTFGDSGELITAAYTLGITHPPGYPLWTLLGKLFTYLPVGSVAYRVNLMSAFFSALSVGLLTLLFCRISEQIAPRSPGNGSKSLGHSRFLTLTCAVSASLCLAFTSVLWSQSVVSEVYSLNVFFAVASLLCLSLWASRTDRPALLYLASFLVGLGLTNHLTLAFVLPGYVYYYIAVGRKESRLLRKTVIAGLWFLLGLSVYAYLPLRARMNPPVNWGGADTLIGLVRHVTRYHYRVIEPLKPFAYYWAEVRIYAEEMMSQFGYLLGVIVFVPLAYRKAGREKRRWLVLTLITFLSFNILLFVTLTSSKTDLSVRFVNEVFYLPSYVFVSAWIFWGLLFLMGTIAPRLTPVLGRQAILGLTAVLIALPVMLLTRNFQHCSMRDNYLASFFGKELLRDMPESAVFFTGTDSSSFITLYLIHVEHFRPDVRIVHITRLVDQAYIDQLTSKIGDVDLPGAEDYIEAYGMYRRLAAKGDPSALSFNSADYGQQRGAVVGGVELMKVNGILAGMIFQRNKDAFPFYYDEGLPVMWMRDFLLPKGLVMELRAQRVGELSLDDEAVQQDILYWKQLTAKLSADPAFRYDSSAQRVFSKNRSNGANVYMHHGLDSLAESAFLQALDFSQANIEAYAGLARLYARQGEQRKALEVFSRYLQMDPYSSDARQFLEWLQAGRSRPQR